MSLVTLATQKLWMTVKTTADDDLIQAAMTAADAAINIVTQRQFVVASASSARVFRPTDLYLLTTDDFTTVSAISNFGAAITAANYQLEPLNNINKAGEAIPYNRILLTYGPQWYRYQDLATVTITAAWGWPAIPPLVIEASKLVAAEIYTNRDSRGGAITVGDAVVFLRSSSKAMGLVSAYQVGGEAPGMAIA